MSDVYHPNIASPEFKADPFPFYARLRAVLPVHCVPLPDRRQAWLVTRYRDVVAVLKDERFVKNPRVAGQNAAPRWMPRMFEPLTRNMLDLDPPDHTRLRHLVHKAFTPQRVDQMRHLIQTIVDGVLDRLRNTPSWDLVSECALPIPTAVIAHMLGIPDDERQRFHRWSHSIVSSTSSRWATLSAMPSVVSFMRYIRRLIELRRARPEDDLLTALITAENDGSVLSTEELIAMVFLLLVAGHETTVNLIGNAVLTLIEHPNELAQLSESPSMFPTATEELLRFAGPLDTATERYARENVGIAGTLIPRGSLVFAVLASANRDAGRFPEAGRLLLTREPNHHVAFGQGIHYCVGAPLARLETQIALSTLLRRTTELRLAVRRDELQWKAGLVLRGLQALPINASVS